MSDSTPDSMGDFRSGVNRSRLGIAAGFSEPLQAIIRRPTRSMLTSLGTFLGVGTLIATNGVAATAQAQIGDRFDALKATEVRVEVVDGFTSNPFSSETDERVAELNGVVAGGLRWTVPEQNAPVRRFADPASEVPAISVVGVSPGLLRAVRAVYAPGGNEINAVHNESEHRVAIIGSIAAESLRVTRTDSSSAVFIGDHAYSIIGRLNSVARDADLLNAVIIPTETAATDFGGVGGVEVVVDVEAGAAGVVADQILAALRPDPAFEYLVISPPDPSTLRRAVTGDLTGLLYLVSALAVIGGLIGIANTTLVSVWERRNEIGLRRAMGARKIHVASQFVVESVAVGALGGVMGSSAGVLVVVAVSAAQTWTATLDTLLVFAAPFVGALTGLVAGLYPAWRASQVEPAQALRM